MTRLHARRKLQRHGAKGNFRFKGLLLAALDKDVSAEDVAKAWPDPGRQSDYRFLSGHSERDAEQEANRKIVAEPGEERHRILRDFVQDVPTSAPKHLSSDPTTDLGDGNLGVHLDKAIPRMLFSASSYDELDTLFREQLLETVMEGAERRKVARDGASNVINADIRRGDVPVASDEGFAFKTSEGAEIRDNREDYATIAWDTTKYGRGARVTDEMRDQAMVDVIERQMQFLGECVENSINRVFLNELVDNANGNFDTAGSNQGYQALNEAVGVVDAKDFVPNTFVSHPEFRTALAADTNLAYANRAGTDEVLRDREGATLFGQIASLDTHAGMSGVTYDSSSNTWGYGADELGAVVYGRDHIHTVIYSTDGNDITIKDYEDPIRDLNGVNARVWCDTVYSQQRAAATIQG